MPVRVVAVGLTTTVWSSGAETDSAMWWTTARVRPSPR